MRGTHYEVLGIEPRSRPDQVEKAYRFCMDLYGDGALATYSLLDAEELRATRERIQEAYQVLRDPIRRREYDVSQGLTPPGAPVLPFPSPAGTAPAGPEAPSAYGDGTLPVCRSGEELKTFRESRGISLRDISLVSKIGVRFLEYIEAERFSLLPAPVYLRGFLMAYAQAVGLDARGTMEAYMARIPREP
jgi:flagellar biosynthesis protein FlhG